MMTDLSKRRRLTPSEIENVERCETVFYDKETRSFCRVDACVDQITTRKRHPQREASYGVDQIMTRKRQAFSLLYT